MRDSLKLSYVDTESIYNIASINHRLYLEYDDKIIYILNKKAIIFHRSGIIESIVLNMDPVYMIKGVYGGIWVGTRDKGLLFFDEQQPFREPIVKILEDQLITSMRYDQGTRGWVTTFTSGIFHVQSIHIKNFSHPFDDATNRVAKMLELDNGDIIAFSQKNKVFLFKDGYQSFEILEMPELNNELIYNVKIYNNDVYIATTNLLVIVPQEYFAQNSIRNSIKVYPVNNIKDFIVQDSVFWMVSSGGIYYLPDLLYSGIYDKQRIPNYLYQRSNKIIEYQSSTNEEKYSYLLYQDLETLWKLRYEKSKPHTAQVASYKYSDTLAISSANDLKMKDDHIFIASKGMGLIVIKHDTLMFYNKTNNLLSNYIEKIEFGNRNELYVATNKGLNILYFSDNSYENLDSINQITSRDGMIGDHIHDFVLDNEYVFCATNYGLSLIHIPQIIGMKDEFPILINKFNVNEKNILNESIDHYDLSYQENNISISFNAIDFHDKPGIKYYYRLIGSRDDSWKEIHEPLVVFPIMAPGKYIFEVMARNSYGFWSNGTAEISFSIDQVYYKTWTFILALFLFLGGLIFFIVRFYVLKNNQLLESQKKLAEYQQQSLTRVINPHFLMNVFNAISSHLFNKKTALAMSYISDVGNLVKHIFNSSYENKISIEEEVKLLSSYIKIEKRRSNSVFNSIIKYKPEIKDYLIPSLMIQIFVENSINHGFADLKERGGLIAILFSKEGGHIHCQVLDNGMGLQKSAEFEKTESSRPRKHGIDIIKERIELLNLYQSDDKFRLEIGEIESQIHHQIIGTKVELWFPLQGKNEIKTT
jgi:hypothetical protein